jgi:hypothetical protein
MSAHALDAQPAAWMDTPSICRSLSISRSTLGRWRRRKLLRNGEHWVKKNQAAPRSDLLWHRQRCAALLRPARADAMAESSPVQGTETAAEYLLLHRDTGTALYATRATEAEIHRANGQLRRSGNRNRCVAARHLPHGRGEGMG